VAERIDRVLITVEVETNKRDERYVLDVGGEHGDGDLDEVLDKIKRWVGELGG
jgi:hypothetical protein